jgi:hypothetical protein
MIFDEVDYGPQSQEDRNRAAFIEEHGHGAPPWPKENVIFEAKDGRLWMLCSDGLWTCLDAVERLIPSSGECATCGCPLHRDWQAQRCRWCRRKM